MKTNNVTDFETTNSLAAIWTMMLPGLGQLMKGRVMAGIVWAFLVSSGYFSFFWPGLVLHGLCILDAAFYKGSGSVFKMKSWPQRFSFIGIVAGLLIYIVARNGI